MKNALVLLFYIMDMFGELNGVLVMSQGLVLGPDGQMLKHVLQKQDQDQNQEAVQAELMNAQPLINGFKELKFVLEEESITIKYMKPLGVLQKFQDQAHGADGTILKIVREQEQKLETEAKQELEQELEPGQKEQSILPTLLVKMPLLGFKIRFI